MFNRTFFSTPMALPTPIPPDILISAHTLWNFSRMHHDVTPSTFHPSLILCMGSHDTRVAERGAELYHALAESGKPPLIICSGGLGRLTEGAWTEPEAIVFARVLQEHGVPASAILVESHSTNTAENVVFSRRCLIEHGIGLPTHILLVHKPYMERRAFATFMAQWGEYIDDVRVTSPQCTMEGYIRSDISFDDVVHLMVGDVQRLHLYAEKGWSAPQDIPPEVWQALTDLISAGYTRHAIQ